MSITLLLIRELGHNFESVFSYNREDGSPVYELKAVPLVGPQPVVGQTYTVTSSEEITDLCDYEKPSKGIWTRIEFTLEGFGNRMFCMDIDCDSHWYQVGGDGWKAEITVEAALTETSYQYS